MDASMGATWPGMVMRSSPIGAMAAFVPDRRREQPGHAAPHPPHRPRCAAGGRWHRIQRWRLPGTGHRPRRTAADHPGGAAAHRRVEMIFTVVVVGALIIGALIDGV